MGKFGDILVDTGRELTLPLRILNGELPYRDFFYPYGPLSPLLLTLYISAAGASLRAFELFGLGISLVCIYLIFSILRQATGPFWAFAYCLIFTFLHFFGLHFIGDNFNFVLPYAFASTLGLALFFLLVYLAQKNTSPRTLGVLLGFCVLTKIEIAAASSIFLLLYLALLPANNTRERISRLANAAAGAALVLGIFASFMWLFDMLPSFLLGLRYLANANTGSSYASSHFFHGSLTESLRWIAISGLGALALLWIPTLKALPHHVSWSITLIGSALYCWALPHLNYFFPLGLLILLGSWPLGKARFSSHHKAAHLALMLSLVGAATILLARIYLAIGVVHYGFYLTLPAFLALALICHFLQARFPRLPHTLLTTLGIAAAVYASDSASAFAKKNIRIESMRGFFYEFPWNAPAIELLDYLKPLVQKDSRILVLPEGAFLQYLLGNTPIFRYDAIQPEPFASSSAEAWAIKEFERLRFDFVVLTNRDTHEFGFRGIGQDYFQNGMQYIERQFERARTVGSPPWAIVYRRSH